MTVHPFRGWSPDTADIRNPGEIVATNVYPGPSGYLPVRTLTAATNAMDARPRGAIQARNRVGIAFEYGGDATKLYQNVSGTWTDRTRISGPYTTGAEDAWEFVHWKEKVLATNFADNPQQITFTDLNFTELTADFRARHITSIRDFVVVANTFDSVDLEVPSRVRWSAFNNELDWTISPATGADFQDLKTSRIERIFGGEFGVIFQSNSIWRMSFVGAPVWFQFDEVLPGIGLIAPGAATQIGTSIYFLSTQGFFRLDLGTQAQPIGVGRVDDFIARDLDANFLHRISSASDRSGRMALWAYPGSQNEDGTPNRIMAYDRLLDKWSLIEPEGGVELLWDTGGSAQTVDTLNELVDSVNITIDSRRWLGGPKQIAAFNGNFESGFFDGPNMTGVIETREFELNPGRRTRLNAFRPLVDGGTVKGRIATRNRQTDEPVYGSSLIQSASGRFTERRNARYHRFQLTVSGDWEDAVGVQVEPREAKPGEWRG